ncbi:MAG TPA: ABC transporter substrate-binding protein [Chloroflexota bacterium]|nr:ABC transporter substrate-binding protein [Chloroflexota bacterium]
MNPDSDPALLDRGATERRFGRREVLRRTVTFGMALPLVSSLLAACSPTTAVAPTSPATTGAAPSAAPAATSKPAVAASPAASPGASPAAAAAASPSAPASPVAANVTSSKPKAIIAFTQEPTSLDPTADATASISTILRDNLYEGLVRLDGSGKLLGALARTWGVSADGTTVTFHLVSGAKWHDGTPFTAQDVKFSWDRAADAGTQPPNPHRDYWAPVKSVDVVDDATVNVTLSTYSDNWLFHMAAGSACIISSKSAATNGTNPVGTGPFKYGNWNRGSSLTLTRNIDYWGNKSRLTDVEFRFFSDGNAANNALKAGDIDVLGQVGAPDQIAQFQADPNFTVISGAASGKVMVSVNETSGPLADKRVRQALYAAIDRKAWIDGYFAGLAVPIGSHATPNDGEPYYADMTAVNTFDPTKARQLLDAAGQSGLKLRLAQISAFPYAVAFSEILASQLQAIGVQLDVQPMEFARWLQQVFLNAQDYDLTIINHIEERDIGNYANPKYYWHYNNPQVTGWLTQADAEPDLTKRNGVYKQIQQQLADDAANLWVAAPNNLGVLKKGLMGYQVQGISPSLYLGDAYFA